MYYLPAPQVSKWELHSQGNWASSACWKRAMFLRSCFAFDQVHFAVSQAQHSWQGLAQRDTGKNQLRKISLGPC